MLLGLSALLLVVGAGCSAVQEQPTETTETTAQEDMSPIKIGFLGPLTGDLASIGQDALKGAELAVEEINAAGGINGRMLELVAEDGKCNPKDASAAGNKLINIDNVPVIVGGLCSPETTAVAPVAEQNKVVMFSPCSSAPNITEAGDYIFRSYPSDAYQGTFAANYVYNTLGKKKVALFADLGDWGAGVKGSFEAAYKELGGEILVVEDIRQTDRDFRTQLTKVKSSEAELIYFAGLPEAGLAFFKQAQELGVELPILGGDVLSDTSLVEAEVSNGVQYIIADVEAKGQEWLDKLAVKGANNTLCAPGSYNNVNILADIMTRVGTDTEMIKNEMYNVKDYQGVNMMVTLDENGDLEGASYVVKEIQNGESVEPQMTEEAETTETTEE